MEIEDPSKQNIIIEKIKEIVKKIEPDVNVIVLEGKDKKLNNISEETKEKNNKGEIIRLAVGAAIL